MKQKMECLKTIKKTDNFLSVGEWIKKWIDTYKINQVKPNTVKAIKSAVHNHFNSIVNINLNDLDNITIQEFLNNIKLSRTKKSCYTILCSCLKKAYQIKLIKTNPMEYIEKVKHTTVQGVALTKTEQKTLINDLQDLKIKDIILFYLNTGVRRNEALTLKWKDIDINNNHIMIKGTKTKKSNRPIPIFDNIKDLLKTSKDPNDFVFDFKRDYLSHEFKRICPNHKLHDLRHTFATNCLEAGINIKVVQEWLGHTSFDSTSDIYSHITKNMHETEAQILSDFMKKKD